jgi:hypothetical protein
MHAEYREESCKSTLNAVRGMPFKGSLGWRCSYRGSHLRSRIRSATPSMEDRAMSIVVRFNPTSMTAGKYDEAVKRHEEVGVAFPPDGLEYHICFGPEGNLRVSEIWDSREQLDAYGERLMPILADVGIEFSGAPEIFEVHRIVRR